MKRQKIIILPRLYDGGGDLRKSWFVHYSCRNPKTGEMDRFRLYDGFTAIKTEEGRRQHATRLIKKYTEQLLAGWTPFQADEHVIYDDQVMYEYLAKNFGRKKKSNHNLRVKVSRYLQKHKSMWAVKTYGTHQSKLRIFTQWCEEQQLSKKDPVVMTHAVLQEFFDFLCAREKSERTVDKYKQVLFRFFEDLQSLKEIRENPVVGIIARGKVVDEAAKPILKEDLDILKIAIQTQDPQLWLACLFQFYCFIRPGTELRLLKVQDINLHSKLITIKCDKAKNRITETVQIPSQFAKLLVTQYRLQDYPKQFCVFGQHGYPGPEPMGRNNFRVRFNRIRDQLGLSKDYKYYSWKHTGATAAVDAGIPERHLMDQLRHKSFESTDHYFRRHIGYRSPAIDDHFPDP